MSLFNIPVSLSLFGLPQPQHPIQPRRLQMRFLLLGVGGFLASILVGRRRQAPENVPRPGIGLLICVCVGFGVDRVFGSVRL